MDRTRASGTMKKTMMTRAVGRKGRRVTMERTR